MAKFTVSTPDGSKYDIEAPEGATQEDVIQQVAQYHEANKELPRNYTLGETVSKGITRGAKQVSSSLFDVLPAMVGSAVGAKDYAARQMEEARQTQEEIAQKYAPEFKSYKDVQGIGQGLKFGLETVSEQLPNIATMLIPGGVGGALARRGVVAGAEKAAAAAGASEAEALLARQAALKTAAARQQVGQNVGIYLGSFSQNAPEIFQNIYNETGELEPGAALLFGSVSAALDSALPASIMRKLTGPAKIGLVEKVLEKSGMQPGLLRKIAAAAPESTVMEGLTEGAQEAISLAAEKFVDKNREIFDSKGWNRIVESSIRGAIAGGVFGTASGAVEGLTKKPVPSPQLEQQELSARDQALQGATMIDQDFTSALGVAPNAGFLAGVKGLEINQENAPKIRAALMQYQGNDAVKQNILKVLERPELKLSADVTDIKKEAEDGSIDATRDRGAVQVSGKPDESRISGGVEEGVGARAVGDTTDVTESTGREETQPDPLTQNIINAWHGLSRTSWNDLTPQDRALVTDAYNNKALDEDIVDEIDQNYSEYARQEAPLKTEHTTESVTKGLYNKIGSSVIKAINRGEVKVLNDVKEAPKGVTIPEDSPAFYHKGIAYLVANRMDPDTAHSYLLHETGFHYGLEGMLGKNAFRDILRGVNRLNKIDPMVTQSHDFVQRKYKNLKIGSDQYLKEVAAKLGELSPNHNLWRKMVAAVKSFLIKRGIYNPNTITAQDIQDVINRSLRQSLAGKVKPAQVSTKTEFAKASLGAVDEPGARRLIDSVGKTYKSLPVYNSQIGKEVQNIYSRMPDQLRAIGLSFLSLPQKIDLYADKLPALRSLLDALEVRASDSDKYRQQVDLIVHDGIALLKKYPQATIDKFNRVGTALSAKLIDPRLTEKQQQNWDPKLMAEWNSLPAELTSKEIIGNKTVERLINGVETNVKVPIYRGLAYNIATQYEQYRLDMIARVEQLSPGFAKELRERFEKEKISFYLPLRRKGIYRLSYNDGTERVVQHFESPAELERVKQQIESKGATDVSSSILTREINYKDTPPLGFVKDIIDVLDKQIVVNENDVDAKTHKESLINEVYRTYLDLFPDESIRQQMRERTGVAGYIEDIVGGFADTGAKLANQLSNLEHRPKIDAAFKALKEQEKEYINGNPEKNIAPHTDLGENAAITQVVQDLINQKKFLDNPIANNLAANLSWVSYIWNIAGNVSSALVNLTQIPMVVLPMLSGEYTWNEAFSAMQNAYGMYFKGGIFNDNNRKFLPDHTFGANLKKGDKYFDLYQEAVKRTAIRRGVGYELTELRNRSAEDFTGIRSKIETGLGWIFQNSERMNREVTLIAAYDLAIKRNGGNTEAARKEAINKAIDLTVRAHSHALSEAGPKMFQDGFGKVAFTFKRFAQTQIYNTARLFHLAFKDADLETRQVARKQLLGIMGMTYMFSGLQGLPLYGALNMLSTAIAGMFGDDEPYDFDEEVREIFGDLGYKGVLNKALNVDIASRTGFNGMVWRDDPRRLSEVGFASYFVEHFFGPAYQALAVNPVRAAKLFGEGQTERAIETVVPSALRNVMKGFRYATEGAMTTNGVKVIDDPNIYNNFMQIWGFTNADLAEAYARAGAMKKGEKKLHDMKSNLLDTYYLAKSSGDLSGAQDIKDKINDFNKIVPAGFRITGDSLARSARGHEQRNRKTIDGVYIDKKLKNYIQKELGA
jgi:hypothetical protein